jgi:hypothetical protein
LLSDFSAAAGSFGKGGILSAAMRRDEQVIEDELMEISAIQDDTIRLERIVAWCALYPNEIPVALRFFRMRLHAEGKGPALSPPDNEA